MVDVPAEFDLTLSLKGDCVDHRSIASKIECIELLRLKPLVSRRTSFYSIVFIHMSIDFIDFCLDLAITKKKHNRRSSTASIQCMSTISLLLTYLLTYILCSSLLVFYFVLSLSFTFDVLLYLEQTNAWQYI
jgi:hypothetical protein